MKKSANKWLLLLAVLLLSRCSAAKEPSTAALSYGSFSAKEHNSSSVDVVPSSDVSQIEESNINYEFPLVEEKDWELGDYKIFDGGAVEKRGENDQDMVFTAFGFPGKQMMGGTAFPLLLEENRFLSSETFPSSEEVMDLTSNGRVEVYTGYMWSFMNGLYAVWEFHPDSEYSNDLAPDYHTQVYSFVILNESLWRNEMQLDLNSLKDIRTLPEGVTWNPLTEQYIVVYGVDDAIYGHSTGDLDESDLVENNLVINGYVYTEDPHYYDYGADGKKTASAHRLPPNHRLAVAVFDSEGRLVKELTSQDYYLGLHFKTSPAGPVKIQILSKNRLLLHRPSASVHAEGNDATYPILVDLDKGTFNRLSIDLSYYDYYGFNLQTEELLIQNNIYTFLEDGTFTSRGAGGSLMRLKEQNGHTVLVPAGADDEKEIFKSLTVPYSAVRETSWGPIKIPGMPMFDKTDLYYTVQMDDLILLMKYPWAQLEKAEAVYGFQYCSDKCNIEFTYVDQDGTVYIKHKHD